MSKLWQLKKLSDGTALTEPQPLPENWGSVFGLHGFIDKLGDLSWLGPEHANTGWFEVGDAPAPPAASTPAELAWYKAKKLLAESDWAMLSDVPLLDFQKTAWIEYRKALRDIRLQPGFPNEIQWPQAPE
jgi:hypothetical protein